MIHERTLITFSFMIVVVCAGCPAPSEAGAPPPPEHSHAEPAAAPTTAEPPAPVERDDHRHGDPHDILVPAWPLRGPKRDIMPVQWRQADLELRSYSLPLNNPPVATVAEAVGIVRDDDSVIGVLTGQGARAYPWWIISKFHAINDIIADSAVFVTQCEVCSGAGAFYPVVQEWLLDFRVCGSKAGTFYVCDYQTRSSWASFSGKAFMGPLAGEAMFRFPAWQTTWGEWRASHPDTTVVVLSEEVRDRAHGKGQEPGQPGVPILLSPTITVEDARLPENALVFGLAGPEPLAGRAWPIATLRERGGLVQDDYNGAPVLLLLRGAHRVGAFVRRLDDHTLSFTVSQAEPLRLLDDGGTTWDEWGRAVDGPLAGKRLFAADGYMAEWFEWVNNHPQTEVAGQGP